MDVAAARVRVMPCDTRLTPQSEMRGLPWSSRSTLRGFRSPCMMPRPCKCTRPWPRRPASTVTSPRHSQARTRGAVPAKCHAARGTLPSHFAGVRGFQAMPSCLHRCTTASGCTCRPPRRCRRPTDMTIAFVRECCGMCVHNNTSCTHALMASANTACTGMMHGCCTRLGIMTWTPGQDGEASTGGYQATRAHGRPAMGYWPAGCAVQPRTSRWICRISRMSTTFNACVVALEAAGAWRRRACNTRCAPPPTSEMTWHQQKGGSNDGQMKGWVRQSSRGVSPPPLHHLIVRVQLAIHKQARRME